MREWINEYRHAAVMVGLTVIVPFLFLVNVVGDLLVTRQTYQSEIDGLEPKIARLRGLLESEQLLKNRVDQLDASLQKLVYPGLLVDACPSWSLRHWAGELGTAGPCRLALRFRPP